MGEGHQYRQELKEIAGSMGAVHFGVASMDGLRDRLLGLTPAAVEGLDRAISMAVRLSRRIMEDIVDGPTRLYFMHYGRVNMLLDETALRISSAIQARGYDALPIPASQIIDWEGQRAHISHKHVARAAGVGWIGRNNLLISPRYGSQIRLVTVLTDMPLTPDGPLDEDCGECDGCLSVCPTGAIREQQEDFDHTACYRLLDQFRRKRNIGQHICGICVKACPGDRQAGKQITAECAEHAEKM
ncbi:MAG: epoxyqueuosine reductase [Deltaproteobacteria bacterium]|nr:epoxyqueuosine reductase [Deltaproteobacteria bacterium]MBW2308902.1 epoxyqueuosine reductase [Deltaproteobacteria bacterium]